MSTRVVRPVNAPITQHWGNGATGPNGYHGHPGTDYAAGMGAPIVACADGVVTWAAPASGFGDHCVSIWHPELGVTSTYGHMEEHDVGYGQQVACGQRIGLADNQGYSFGSHLHFEIRPLNTPFGGNPPNIDSEQWLLLHLSGVLPNVPALTAADRAQIKRLQYLLGVTQDGYWGKQTDDALDVLRWKLLVPPRPVQVSATVKAIQHDIYHFGAADCDGIWGHKTDAAFLLARMCWLNR